MQIHCKGILHDLHHFTLLGSWPFRTSQAAHSLVCHRLDCHAFDHMRYQELENNLPGFTIVFRKVAAEDLA
jgi:hypothetical protein